MDQILDMASPKDLLVWIVCAVLILQVILKYYPTVRGWFKKDFQKETKAQTVDQRLDALEQDMKEVKAKLDTPVTIPAGEIGRVIYTITVPNLYTT